MAITQEMLTTFNDYPDLLKKFMCPGVVLTLKPVMLMKASRRAKTEKASQVLSNVKQFIRNAQNCGKINHGFCTTITHQLTH